jgi:murein L,D-transpeptidase YafK
MRNFRQYLFAALLFTTMLHPIFTRAATTEERLQQYGTAARARLKPYFEKQSIAYPPSELIFVGLKEEKVLEIYARSGTNDFKFIRSYPILAASGVAGPKLREGDKQVPEGIYPVEWLNPNSSYHLSMRIGYPNAADRAQAAKEGRSNLGGDIMIHGKAKSVGCLAMGDEAAEDFFVLAADTGIEHITVILTPVDFREGKALPKDAKTYDWTDEIYAQIKERLAKLKKEQK